MGTRTTKIIIALATALATLAAAGDLSAAEQRAVRVLRQPAGVSNTVQLDPECLQCIPEGCRIDCSGLPTVRAKPQVMELQINAPDLGHGHAEKIKGQLRDEANHIINGTLVVWKDGHLLGSTTTSAGYFRIFDVPAGQLTLAFLSSGGLCTASKLVNVPETGSITANITVVCQ